MNPDKSMLDALTPLQKAFYKMEQFKAEIADLKKNGGGQKDIAVIGMALRFPKASSPKEFWQNLIDQKDHIAAFPENRKEALKGYYKALGLNPEQQAFFDGAFLEDIDAFDYEFFNLKPREAAYIHPLQRLFLLTSWRALEDAGYHGADRRDKKIGVYLGASGDLTYSQYLQMLEKSELGHSPVAFAGNSNSVTSSRISYFLDLQGPAITIDTACSSSLVAIHNACKAISSGDCEMAIAGGGRLHLLPESGKYQMGFESPNSRTRPFDADADGAGIGEGVAAIILKPLDRAIEDQDKIYGVIKGSAINQDGTSAGITAPNLAAQIQVVQDAWKNADIHPSTISYIESHGTGTALGDPIEFQALTEALPQNMPTGSVALGALKGSIGHLFEAAGIAGLIKCLLALNYKKLPGAVNHDRPNQEIDFNRSPLFLNTDTINWNSTEHPRRCGVSSFGISGTNAHVVLEEFSQLEEQANTTSLEGPFLFTLSAKTEQALNTLIANYSEWIQANPKLDLEAIVYSNNVSQANYSWRFATVVEHKKALLDSLASPSDKKAMCKRRQRGADLSYKGLAVGTGQKTVERLTVLANAYLNGTAIDWKLYYDGVQLSKLELPIYPLDLKDCRLTYLAAAPINAAAIEETEEPTETRIFTYDELFTVIRGMIVDATGLDESELLPEVDFFDLGIDSLDFIKVIQEIHKQFGIKLDISQFFQQLDNLEKLTRYLHELEPQQTTNKTAGTNSAKTLGKQDNRKGVRPEKINYFVPYKKIKTTKEDRFTSEQLTHIDWLTNEINTSTKETKVLTQNRRSVLANFRNVVGFRPETKELSYQVIAASAKGSKVYDIDGNGYIDLTMGFGVNLLGYNPEFIQEALLKEMRNGFPVGPMATKSGEVAALICEMANVERVSFYNSGSEAVMFALRLAKATTKRSKYVVFKGSYHGTYDGVLALPDAIDPLEAVPMAPGISDSAVQDAIVLDYGTEEALEVIRELGDELAAVLVEPVQSRRPDLQPKAFLHAIRAITEQTGAAFILDEVITGFRIHQGGSQAWFGVEADLVTYGKIVGGGMPIGVVAGKAKFMDAVDGGMWRFGDKSCPDKTTTFVAGTFCEHPLAMQASYQILSHLKAQGTRLQEALNEKSVRLMERLNAYFEAADAPVQMIYFGSQFRFILNANWDLFYQHLQANGVYVWEGRNCFLSTAHTEEDLDFIFQAVVRSVEAMRKGGWKETRQSISLDKANQGNLIEDKTITYSEDQEGLLGLVRSNPEASSAFNENQIVDLDGPLDQKALEKAILQVINRHDALRTLKLSDTQYEVGAFIAEAPIQYFSSADLVAELAKDADLETFIAAQSAITFDLAQGPFLRFTLMETGPDQHKLLMTIHHLIADGWSIEVVWTEISRLYTSFTTGEKARLTQPVSLAAFNNWVLTAPSEKEFKSTNQFWLEKFSQPVAGLNLPYDVPPNGAQGMEGTNFSIPLEKDLQNYLSNLANQEKTTLYNILLTAYNLLLFQLTNQERFIIGVPTSGQLQMGESCLVGQCVKMLPFYSEINPEGTIAKQLEAVKDQMASLLKHQNCSFFDLLNQYKDLTPPFIATSIDMNSVRSQMKFGELDAQITLPKINYVKYDLSVSIIEMEEVLTADFFFNTALLNPETVQSWANEYLQILETIALHPDKLIKDLATNQQQQTNALFSNWNNF